MVINLGDLTSRPSVWLDGNQIETVDDLKGLSREAHDLYSYSVTEMDSHIGGKVYSKYSPLHQNKSLGILAVYWLCVMFGT